MREGEWARRAWFVIAGVVLLTALVALGAGAGLALVTANANPSGPLAPSSTTSSTTTSTTTTLPSTTTTLAATTTTRPPPRTTTTTRPRSRPRPTTTTTSTTAPPPPTTVTTTTAYSAIVSAQKAFALPRGISVTITSQPSQFAIVSWQLGCRQFGGGVRDGHGSTRWAITSTHALPLPAQSHLATCSVFVEVQLSERATVTIDIFATT
jgi:hypothetical protein